MLPERFPFRPPEDRLGSLVPGRDATLQVERHDGVIGRAIQDLALLDLHVALLQESAAQFELGHGLAS
ncbi:hypothetical protein JNW90_26625 [Micromonospora sp. STR1s_5]|nr:hypothetical protein [Micromonospora sp. STR1s_5]